MGKFLNKGNLDFKRSRRSEYVDKSAMIQVINESLDTEFSCSCVTRARRFGKSVAAKMLCAYYDKSCDSRHLFENLAIAKMPSFEEHLNKYPTLYVDMTKFTTEYKGNPDIVRIMQQTIKKEVCKFYADVMSGEPETLMDALFDVADTTKERFVMIIDEWDAILREFDDSPKVVDSYVNWLRRMFKTDETAQVFMGVYMTGILPIKKYDTESALNNFREYSMINPGRLAPFLGFTHDEVEVLCSKYDMEMKEMERWYDGYRIGNQLQMFNPYSVMNAVCDHCYRSYWQATGSYEKVATYIQMNFEGLKDDIVYMLAGGSVGVNTIRFENDMSIVKSKDDVLTVLIHLGYLTYDFACQKCYIPNKEVADQFSIAVQDTSWTEIVKIIQNSQKLMEATWDGDEDFVAKAVQDAHCDNVSILNYNDENSLACALSIAYLWARNEYVIHRELATGLGYADLVMIPKRNSDKPALVVELKFNTSVETAVDQIRKKDYPAKIKDYTGNILLVGISYDKGKNEHSCRIEKA